MIPLRTSPEVTVPRAEALETEIFDHLEGLSSYNDVFLTFTGGIDPEQFVLAADASPRCTVISNADGPFSIVQGGEQTADRSGRSDAFDFHTDGFYLPKVPPLFVLGCDDPGREGATTVFSNTKEALQRVESHLPILELLRFVYIAKDLQHYARPVIERHPIDGSLITNLVTRGFVEPVVDEQTLPTLPDYRFINEAMTALYTAIEVSIEYEHTWQKGDVIVADNHTYVHARKASKPDPTRRLTRFWLDFTSNEAATEPAIIKEIVTEPFASVAEQATETAAWQDRYLQLVTRLGEIGSQVEVDRVIEQDEAIAPHVFYRYATHEFIFPSQGALEIQEDASGFFDNQPGYQLYRDKRTYVHDNSSAQDRIRLHYSDSQGHVDLQVVNPNAAREPDPRILDLLSSVLPEDK